MTHIKCKCTVDLRDRTKEKKLGDLTIEENSPFYGKLTTPNGDIFYVDIDKLTLALSNVQRAG